MKVVGCRLQVFVLFSKLYYNSSIIGQWMGEEEGSQSDNLIFSNDIITKHTHQLKNSLELLFSLLRLISEENGKLSSDSQTPDNLSLLSWNIRHVLSILKPPLFNNISRWKDIQQRIDSIGFHWREEYSISNSK